MWTHSTHGSWVYCRLAGLTYRSQAQQEIFTNQVRDAHLDLVRDRTNTADSNAIMVEVRGTHVGFLPREVAAIIAPMIDKGKSFVCTVIDSNPQKPCIRVKEHPLSGQLDKDHPWHEHLSEDSELEERKQKTGYYTQLEMSEMMESPDKIGEGDK